MKLIPAIDIRNGQCVRLKQGDPNQQTNYEITPLEMAKSYYESGIQQIHIVDLDGAFAGENKNTSVVQEIINKVPVNIELGGGIRTLSKIKFWLKTGIHQVILGTAAIENLELVKQALEKFGEGRIIIGIDAKDGKVATHGWKNISEKMAIEFGENMVKLGITRFIFTDIKTDGMFTGPNIKALSDFANSVQIPVTASGGISTLDDLIKLKKIDSKLVDSVIVGRAIYENRFNVSEALQVLNEAN